MFNISHLEQLLDEARKRDLKYDWTDELDKYKDRENIFVHFSKGISDEEYAKPSFHKNEPKIGINPKQNWISTPMGLYAYPLDDMMYDIFKTKSRMFATDFPFVYFIEVNKNVKHIEDISKMTSDVVEKYVKELKKVFPKQTSELELESRDGEKFWSYLKRLAQVLNSGNTGSRSDRAYIIKFASLLYKVLGIEWVGDTGGNIHPNEPHQAVFFTKRSYKVLKMVENQNAKKSLYGVKDGVENAKEIISKLPTKVFVRFAINHPDLIVKIVNSAIHRTNNYKQLGSDADWMELTRYPELFNKFLEGASLRNIIKFVPDDSPLLDNYIIGDDKKFLNYVSDEKFNKIMSNPKNVEYVKDDIAWLFLKRGEYASSLIKTQEDFEEAVDGYLRVIYANQYEHDIFELENNFIEYCKSVRTKFVLHVANYYKERMKDFSPYKRLVNVMDKMIAYRNFTKNEDGTYSVGGDISINDSLIDEEGKLLAPLVDVGWVTSNNSQISSLKGLPNDIEGLSILHCNQLHNLEGCPNKIGELIIDNCGLRSVDGIGKNIGKLEIRNCRLLRDVRELEKLNPDCKITLTKNRPIELNTQLDSSLVKKINLTENNTFQCWSHKYQQRI